MDCGEVGEYSVRSNKLRRKNGYDGLQLRESPGNGPPRRFGEFGEAQIMERFPKNPQMRKVEGVLYNCVAALRAPTFTTLLLHVPPQPSHF